MEILAKLSFYCLTAASVAIVAALACSIGTALGRLTLRRVALVAAPGLPLPTVGAAPQWSAPGSERFATLLLWFAATFQGLALLSRIIVAQRGPYGNMFEFSLAFLFALLVVYLVVMRIYRAHQVGGVVLLVASGMLLYIWSLPASVRQIDPLIPALQNPPLLTAHVTAAVFAYATFAVSFAAAVLYLAAGARTWLPNRDLLDDLSFRAVSIGFPMLSLVLIIGSIWADKAWGSYWSWDPKETAALLTWLIYAIYLHTRTLRGWRGERSALILLIGFAAVVFTYFGNYFFGGMHAYGGV